MDIELTGNETPEQLEALIDGFGDVDISDVTQTAAVTTSFRAPLISTAKFKQQQS